MASNRKDEPIKLDGRSAELLAVAELAVTHSGGRLRLAHNEKDKSRRLEREAQRFLKLDHKRLGRDVELYGRMIGDTIGDWPQALVMFLEEILLPLKQELPESYAKAGEALRKMGDSVYEGDTLRKWQELF